MSFKIKSRASLPGGCILNAPEDAYIVTVNVVGAMGAGIALAVRERYRDVYLRYRKYCKSGKFQSHNLMAFKSPDKTMVLFPTKIDWKDNSPIGLILANLVKLEVELESGQLAYLTSIAIPPLGQANGKLSPQHAEMVNQAVEIMANRLTQHCVLYK